MTKDHGLRTLEGVYVPTLLTILGVIMYLRLGWVVGNAGLLGALVIIGIAHTITIATTLSMSSIISNIKVGSGGAYSIITQSLGIEMGGAIGIPLYLSQAFSVAFYIRGFTELWAAFFPNHPIWVIAIIIWAILTGLSMYSVKLAFKMQYVVLVVVFISLISFKAGNSVEVASITLIGAFENVNFWQTFAIFFPAVTGILTGASMSGELKDPRRSIIKGTMGAVLTGLVVYSLVAYLFSVKVPVESLLDNSLIILDISYSKIAVIAGVMGAVLSSALSTLVSAPRTVAALAENRVVPFHKFLAQKNGEGEPKNAIIFSSLLSLTVLLLGNLNGLASLLTLFFLTTYGMINIVVFLEKATGIVSFRPSMPVSIIIPIIGFVGSIFSMILINPLFSAATLIIVTIIYYRLTKNNLVSPWGDVRGGIFRSIAEWAAQKSMNLPYHPKLWKPSIVIPVESSADFKRITYLIKSIIYPSGRVYYLSINKNINSSNETKVIREVLEPLKEEKLFAHEILIHGGDFVSELSIVLQSLSSTFLPPNCIFFTISEDVEKQQRLKTIISSIIHAKIGMMCLHHSKYAFGQSRNIHLWLRDKSPNNNLAVLCALQISRNWNANLTLCRVVENKSQIKKVKEEVEKFIDDARLHVNTKIMVQCGKFEDIIMLTSTDLHILGMPVNKNNAIKFEDMVRIIDYVHVSVLFVADSGLENALV